MCLELDLDPRGRPSNLETMKRGGLSLRYKILFLLTAVPAVTLAAYLALALRIFEDDKIAYVFDATTNMSGTLASQIKTQMNASLLGARPLFQDFVSNQGQGGTGFSGRAEALFAEEPLLDALVVYQQKADGNFETRGLLEKSQGLFLETLGSRQATLSRDFAEALRDNRVVRALPLDDRILILEKVDLIPNRATIFALVTRIPETAEMFRTSLSQRLYLVDTAGNILFGPEDNQETNLSRTLPLSLFRGERGRVAQGAETVDLPNGEKVLASFAQVGFGDLTVVSAVDKAKALSAVDVLLRRSVIFFVILLAATVMVSLLASGRLTRALSSLFIATQKVSEGDFSVQVKVTSRDEVGALADNFNLMAAEVSRLLDQTAEKARMEAELQTAKTVQDTLFPEALAQRGGLEIAGFYEPASECGGDWWHHCQIGDKVFLWIGDATGHGAPAALITSAAKSASAIIENMDVGPGQAMAMLNRSIFAVSKGQLMMTFFIASFDTKSKILTYANASHEAPFLMKPSLGELKKKNLVSLNEVTGPRLGQALDTVYEEAQVTLEDGDMVFFYTDGIPDIQSPAGEAWGERTFIKTMLSTHQDFPTAEQSVARFVDSFQAFRQNSQLIDDVTFFVVKNRDSEVHS